jgi:hypothetical protein
MSGQQIFEYRCSEPAGGILRKEIAIFAVERRGGA